MVPVIYAPEAERDLDAITAHIAQNNPNAAEQFGYRLRAHLRHRLAEKHRRRQRLGSPRNRLLVVRRHLSL
jgi:plasmid stabilization system protein ParE